MKASFSLAAALAATFVLAAPPTCGGGSKCPSDSPCCSSYGQCGVGAYCLGGCDPQNSFDLQSCVAAPVCKSQDYKLNSLNDIASNTKYLGDASKANWVSSGIPLAYSDSVLLTMPPSTVGTLLSSTHYVWYGKISATLATSAGAGVVTAFIMMSDVKDEIDFEFVGVDLEHAQSNFYFQGITTYTNGANLSVSNTQQNLHTYTIDWQPDTLTWAIDGNVMRTLKKSDTWNSTDNKYHYPQTPSRIQLSLWPAGLPSNGQGTIDWAGGLINWDSNLMTNGYYSARVTDVNVQCYDKPSSFNQNHGDQVYYYTDVAGLEANVATGNNNTILSSFYSTGDNPSYCPGGCASSVSGVSQTATAVPTSSNAPETVPGMTGSGTRGDSSTSNSDSSGSSSGSSGSSSSSSSSDSSSGSGQTSFQQNMPTSDKSDASKIVAGSAFALVGFFVAALML
ncbi:hypothetical protein AMS68_005092 [Peltaster fructicola]|uniref:Crh-like protein n=1 Tax=Peltaster fructicola TaxID=286661 RepID=A0A6H0XY42_9PEZI|nr:hypothetical protein AMS68_005092 [Peltaster fructicola]